MNHANRQRENFSQRVFGDIPLRGLVPAFVVCLTMLMVVVPALSQETTRVLRFEADGRVRLEVHDPDGKRLGRDVNEIDAATFEEVDDGMVLEITDPVAGDYELHVDADGSANRVHLFDVWVTDGATTVSLAERELIMNVPSDPYIIRVTESGLSDVTGSTGSGGEGGEGSSFPVWIIVVVAVVVGGVAAFMLLRSRRRSP